MKHHPEQREDEIYMGNTDDRGFLLSSWVSKRMGEVAYQINGALVDAISAAQLHPWFIVADEVEQAIRQEEAAQRPWSAEKITTYREMLDERSAV